MNNSLTHQKKLLFLLACAVAAWLPFSAQAAEQGQEPDLVPTLPMVTVEATRLDLLIGASRLNREKIDDLPTRNGSINELLSVLPGVQFAEEKDSSFKGGEIKPPNISISGGRTNDNNFLLDGIGNNSLLDPLFDNPNNPFNIPGHPQEIFIGTNLIEDVTVYEHNIPARLGGFTGGVIEVNTKDPVPEFEGRIKYRTTRDDWTKFHVSPADLEDFNLSGNADKHNRFEKHEIGVELNIPLNTSNRTLFGYEQRFSKIPLKLLSEEHDQYRRSETFLFKYLRDISAAEVLRVSLSHSPHQEKHFLRNTKDSQFSLDNAGSAVTASYTNEGLSGDTTLKAAVHISDDIRTAPQNLLSWDAADDTGVPTSKSWGTLVGNNFSKEGGLGNLERNQKSIEVSADWRSVPVAKGPTDHTFNIGLLVENVDADMLRKEDAFSYATPVLQSNLICAPEDIACVTNEQFLSKRRKYLASSASAEVNTFDAYLEDDIYLNQFQFRPGVRYSYDDLMKNNNLAPRLAASYDLFDNGNTLFIAGWNRYFNHSNLIYQLRESIEPQVLQVRTYDSATGTLSDWASQPLISPLISEFTRLKTPHSDEVSIGLAQKSFGGRLLIEYIERNYRNQLAREIAPFDATDPFALRAITLNNNGRKDYRSARLSWERQWQEHFLSFNLTWEEVETSNDSYDDNFDDEDLAEQIWYNGKLIYTYELPRDNFTRPWTVNLIWKASLPYRLTFTNTTKFRSSYRALEDTFQNTSDGYNIFDEVRTPASLTFDWRLSWELRRASNPYGITLAVDIYNVFNRKNRIYNQNPNPEYGLGRQFWAELALTF